MINIDITLKKNHIVSLIVKGHASIFPIETKKNSKIFSRKKSTQENNEMGNIPCAGVSIMCKSFIESLVMYTLQKKESIDSILHIIAMKEGDIHIALSQPDNDPLHVHRYAIEQMLLVGLNAVAQEYPTAVQLKVHR